MNERTFRFWTAWMFVTSLAMALFGIVLVLTHTRVLPGMTSALGEHFWKRESIPEDVLAYHHFVHAVLGAVTSAWGVTLAFIVRYAFSARQAWAWTCIAVAAVCWFVLDSGFSALAGVWANVLLNAASVFPFALALIATRRAFVNPAKGRR